MYSIIALDGPAASGKTSVARRVARVLGFAFVGTGSMYRAVTLAVLRRGIDYADSGAITKAMEHDLVLEHGFETRDDLTEGWFTIDGHRASEEELASDEVNAIVSQVAGIPAVRQALVDLQRSYAENKAVVMEGRDIGTVVFPDTPYKIFVTASVEVRSARRAAQGQLDDLAARDQRDKSRKHSPLREADDARMIDSTELNLDQTVAAVIAELHRRGLSTEH